MKTGRILSLWLVSGLTLSQVQATVLEVEIGNLRSAQSVSARVEDAGNRLTRQFSRLTEKQRFGLKRARQWDSRIPLTLPLTVHLTRNHERIALPTPFVNDGGITLQFDTTGSGAFPTEYRQLLQDVFNQAQSTLNAVFGAPAVGGVVHVRNFDVTITDREAVTGGIFLPNNGSSEQEIRFPIYANNEAAAVNFIHCLLLAYMGPNGYSHDAFREGLVRAATMRVARTAGALPSGLDLQLIENALDNTYDVGTWYEQYNQPALGGEKFIAPNLLATPLPPGGSVGGLYLLRYQMAGSAWQKVIAEYPAFIATLNQTVYTTPGLGSDVTGLVAESQDVINTLAGSGSATVEGISFEGWFERQRILSTTTNAGLKLLVQPVPIPPESGTSDFGVFDVVTHWFETKPNGDEILLSGTSYPIFWNAEFDRFFPSSQEDRMDLAGAYGSVTPNLPNFTGGAPYRCAIDIPIQDRISRVFVPAGAVATGFNTTPNDFFGTVSGLGGTGTHFVRLTYGATTHALIPVTFGAFKARIDTPAYLGYNRCRVEVIEDVGGNQTVIYDRKFNKGPGALAVHVEDNGTPALQTFVNIPKGLSTIGLNVEPFLRAPHENFLLNINEALIARWNGVKVKYDIWPDTGSLTRGNGYFVRMPAATPVVVRGRSDFKHPATISLRPGWNLISSPVGTTETTQIEVIKAAESPKSYADAIGIELGTTFFEFVPGPNDAATGAPEGGTMVPATQFESGKAYFVRILNAEGVTLVFDSSVGDSPLRAGNPPKLLMKAKVKQGQPETHVLLGQAVGATAGFDRAHDSGLPPGVGGLQGYSVGAEKLYSDIRSSSNASSYVVTFDGLIPGNEAVLTTEFVNGRPPRYRYRQSGSSQWTFAQNGLNIRFTPRSSTLKLEFKFEAEDR